MIYSMTGYGRGEVVLGNTKIIVELKSLNGKSPDISTHITPLYINKELQFRQIVTERLVRGKIDLTIRTEEVSTGTSTTLVSVNKDVVGAYISQIKSISKDYNISEPQDWWSTIVRLPGILQTSAKFEPTEEEWSSVNKALNEAIESLIDFRCQEGHSLSLKFMEKIGNIKQLLQEIEVFESIRVEKIKNRIKTQLTNLNVEYDTSRFEQEMIYYIEKLDVNEEKQRLFNHLNYFEKTMLLDGCQGKKLGFIAQEMGREINTLGSKSNMAEMQNLVVKMKDELEQIKEQVLNVL